MKNCALKPQVLNPNGEYVDSELFNSLLHFTGNDRILTKQYYSVGTDKRFLDEVSNEAKFDENGEITFKSLKDLASINLDEDRLLNILNKDLGSGIFEYSEGISKLQTFNRSNPYNDKYMATLIPTEGKKYTLTVVKKTPTNESSLYSIISGRNLFDRLKFYLNKAGADFEFIDADSGMNGRYSTKNAKQAANSLYQLILIAKNKEATTSLAEETGHFAIGALGNHQLVTRLEALLTPEVQKAIMGDQYDSIKSRSNPAREVAGYLVGQALAGEADQTSNIKNLINRIVSQIKRVFNTFKGNEINNAILEADRISYTIAEGFMSPDFIGTIDNALNTEETLYSTRDSINVETYKKIMNILKIQTQEMKAINTKLYKEYRKRELRVENVGHTSIEASIFTENAAIDGILEAVDLIADSLPEMIGRLESIDFNAGNVTSENASYIREVRSYVSSALSVLEILNQALNSNDSRLKLNHVNDETIDKLKTISSHLRNAILGDNRLLSNLELKEREFHIKFLESILGSTYVKRAARVVFNFKPGGKVLEFKGASEIPITKIVDAMEKDITWHEAYLTSMSNNSDLTAQIADKAIKLANKHADEITLQVHESLRGLEVDLKKTGLKNTDKLCEISPRTGKLTGNIVSEYVWGDYESDYAEFVKLSKEEFLANTNLEGLTDNQKALKYQEFFDPRVKVWRANNSLWNPSERKYYPNHRYLSKQYIKLMTGNEALYDSILQEYSEAAADNFQDFRLQYHAATSPHIALKIMINKHIGSRKNNALFDWYNKYLELKTSLDGFLPEGSTNKFRMPQFKGTTSNKIRNRMKTTVVTGAVSKTLRRNLIDTFCEDSTDQEYGSDQNYNRENDDIFGNQLTHEQEQINRLPIFGVNKLDDIEEISTDLFHSTLAYASMATSFSAMTNMVDVMEISKQVLKRRKVGGIKSETERNKTSRAYVRYIKFLDKQVYGINIPKIKIGKRLVVNKVVGFFTGLASKLFLGGNIAGGSINALTGSIEIFKEALSGEFFSASDWTKANKEYWKNLPSNLLHAGDDVKFDKVSLFVRYMNVYDRNKEDHRKYFTRKHRAIKLNPFGENLFFPYKCGEHYMQSMAFLSLANKIKLKDSNGNNISLYNSFDVVDIDPSNPKVGKKLKLKEGIQYLDPETGELRDWNLQDMSSFMDKAREINIRMHGIYNNSDKVAIQQNIYGNALLSMRGYALGMIQRRFGVNMYSTALGGETEGSLRTVAKVIGSTFTDKGNLGMTLRAILLPTSKHTEQMMLDMGFSANQYRNMKRNLADMSFIAALYILKLVLAKGGEDDEDEIEDNFAMGLAYYATSRLFSEQSAFNTPWGAIKESAVVTNFSPVGFSVAEDLIDIAVLGAEAAAGSEDAFYKSNGPGYSKGDSKWNYKLMKMLPYSRTYLTMQNPYKAAEGYQYGRANTIR